MSSTWTQLTSCSAVCLAAAALPLVSAEWVDPGQATTDEEGKVLWYDARLLTLEGKGWEETKDPYDRLPARAEGVVRPPVWGLSRNSAGICVRFLTDSTFIRARWKLHSGALSMNHMPATGKSGMDLYVKLDNGKWRWLGIGRPSGQENDQALVSGLPPGEREYMVYFPLYNGVSSVAIGIGKSARIAKAVSRSRPIVFYGTSITQGGCASRPGMVHTAMVGRRLDRPVINLGFSGNGKMEAELADLLAELDPAVYVLDCLPNMSPGEVATRIEPFVRTLRKARPATPILLVEDRSYANSFLLPGHRKRNLDSRAALRTAYENLSREGIENLHYLEGEHLLGDDGEGTVDGSHPTDLGFFRQARAFLEALEPILKATRTTK